MKTDHIKKRLAKKFLYEISITFFFLDLRIACRCKRDAVLSFLADFTRHRALFGKSFHQADLRYEWKWQKCLWDLVIIWYNKVKLKTTSDW
jgi:hypothetical protein